MAAEQKKAPAFQFYPREYLTDEAVIRMTLEQQGAYVRLLAHQWLEGSVPSDTRGLAALCGVTPARMKVVWPGIAAKFPAREDGRLANTKLEEIRREQLAYRQQQSNGGKVGAEKRWGSHRSPSGSPTPDPMRFDSSAPAPVPASAITDREAVADAPAEPGEKRPKRRTAYPDSFEPNDTDRKLAASLSNVRLSVELPKFHDYHTAKGSVFKDWHAALRTWLRNAQEFNSRRGPSAGSEASQVKDELPRSNAPREGTPPTAMEEVRRREREDAERADSWGRQNPELAKAIADDVAAEMGLDPKWKRTPRTIVEAAAKEEWRKRVLEHLQPRAVA